VEAASFLVERPAAEDDRSTTHCAAGSPSSRRSVASVVRRLVRALSSRTRGQNSRANRERGWRPGLSAIQAKSDLALPLLIRGSGWPSHSILNSPSRATRSIQQKARASAMAARLPNRTADRMWKPDLMRPRLPASS
jgi:hypothetical protein